MLNFTGIIGYDDLKNELEMIGDTISNPDKYDRFNVKSPKSILIYGDHGMGKTSWDKRFMESFDFPCIPYVKSGELCYINFDEALIFRAYFGYTS